MINRENLHCLCGRRVGKSGPRLRYKGKYINTCKDINIGAFKRIKPRDKSRNKNVYVCKCGKIILFELLENIRGYNFSVNPKSIKELVRNKSGGERKRSNFSGNFRKRERKSRYKMKVLMDKTKELMFKRFFSNKESWNSDLIVLKLEIKKETNDPLQIIGKGNGFFDKFLCNYESLTKEEVIEAMNIIIEVTNSCMSDPKNFFRNLLNSPFITKGFNIFLRSKYFEGSESVEILAKFINMILKYFRTNKVKNLLCYDLLKKTLSDSYEEIQSTLDLMEQITDEIKGDDTLESKSEEESDEEENSDDDDDNDEQPEKSFRITPVVPVKKDFKSITNFPSKNLFYWKNTEEYLSTHFNLIREDFIRPLKEGWKSWKDHCSDPFKKHDFRDMMVFVNVRFERHQIEKEQLEFIVRFSIPDVRNKRDKKGGQYHSRIPPKSLLRNSLVVLFDEKKKIQYQWFV